jgi:hypothetical protein
VDSDVEARGGQHRAERGAGVVGEEGVESSRGRGGVRYGRDRGEGREGWARGGGGGIGGTGTGTSAAPPSPSKPDAAAAAAAYEAATKLVEQRRWDAALGQLAHAVKTCPPDKRSALSKIRRLAQHCKDERAGARLPTSRARAQQMWTTAPLSSFCCARATTPRGRHSVI